MNLWGSTEDGLTDMYINSVLKKTCKSYEGCFSSDNIPSKLSANKHANIIVNLSPYDRPGTHFITIILKPEHVLYFDSLGNPCTNGNIFRFMKSCDRPIIINNLQVQHPLSNFCGFFCMAMCLYHDRSRDMFLNFSTDLYKNDDLAVFYVQQMIEMQ